MPNNAGQMTQNELEEVQGLSQTPQEEAAAAEPVEAVEEKQEAVLDEAAKEEDVHLETVTIPEPEDPEETQKKVGDE